MKKEKTIFARYALAIKKINKHTIGYQKTMDNLSDLPDDNKERIKLKRKLYAHMRAVNHNCAKCSRYDKLIKFYGTFYQVEEVGEVLAQVASFVEGETFRFEEIIGDDECHGVIVREHDAQIYANIQIEGDSDYQDCHFYGSLYDKENACLKADFSAFPYLKDYLDRVIDYRYRGDVRDDYKNNRDAMNDCYLRAFKDFIDVNRDFIKSKHQYLDEDLTDEYLDTFILARTAS